MQTSQFRAIVADDHPLFRSALKQAVSQVVDGQIAESSCLGDTLELLATHGDVELVFLDLNMPGNEGLVGLTTLRSHYPDVLVVIVSAQEDASTIHKAMDLGASGYIPKSTPLDTIAEAVEEVLDGEQWVPADLSALEPVPATSGSSDFAQRLAQLTPHQFTVLKMMADGLLNKQIAYELGVKESTIKQHGSAVLKKLGVLNRTQAGVLFKQAMGTNP